MSDKKFAIVMGLLILAVAFWAGVFYWLRPALKFIGFI